jgi:hypothetical protein
LSEIGLDLTKHDVRFVEDNWESPTLGAWGLGPLYLGKLARKLCELGKDGKSNTFISLEVQYNMITFNGISVLNFRFKRYSL